MDLPISSFWLLNESISRIRAEDNLRNLATYGNAQSKDGGRSYQKTLVIEMGKVAIEDPIKSAYRDEDGFNRLKLIANRQREK